MIRRRENLREEELVTMPAFSIDYFNYLSGVRGKSNLTVLEYASDLRSFFRFLKLKHGLVPKDQPFHEIPVADLPQEYVLNATLGDGYAYLAFCKNQEQNDNNARARKVVSIRRFYKYLKAHDVIQDSPMLLLESPGVKRALPKYLTLDQSKQLLAAVDGKYRARDFCILTLFLNTGLRLSELIGINLSDFHDDGTLRVLGKGNKERTVYLNNACTEAIRLYMKERPADQLIDRDALFVSNQRKRMSKRSVQAMVEKYLEKSGLSGQGYSTHKLRHTAATLMYQYGHVDPIQLKEILGHENLSTTEIYTHVYDEQLRAAVDSNPLNTPSKPDQSGK